MSDRAITLFSQWADAGRAVPMGHSHAPRATQALEQLPLRPGQHVADLGCGEGWASRWLAERVGAQGRVVGVDGSEAMLAQARQRPLPGLRYQLGSLLDLPFPDGSLDHVFSMEALYYVDLDEALAEAARVLRPGGWLVACTDFYGEHAASHAWPEQLGLPMDLRPAAGWRSAFHKAGLGEVRSTLLVDPAKASHPGTLAVFGQRR